MARHLKDYFTKGYYPYARQQEGIRAMMKHHYFIMNGKPGVGKTIMTTAVACLTGKKMICIVPSSLKLNWKNEINKYCDLRVRVINTGRDLNGTYNSDWDILICSYSFINRIEEYAREAEIYAFDEAHYLCNPESQRTQNAHELVERFKPERVLLLSGTPIKNRVLEYYSLLALVSYNPKPTSGVDISISYDNYWKFADTFSHRVEYGIGRRKVVKYEGTRNIPELKRLLKNKMMTMTLEEVTEIPPIQHIDVVVGAGEVDDKLLDDFLNGSGHISTSKAKSALSKAKHTVNYVKDLMDQGPVVVFTDHVKSAESIHKGIKNSGIITGEVNTNKRSQLVEDFQSGKIDCLVCTIGAASVGFTLTRSRDIVFNDLSWVEADNEQARKRIHRVGQEKKARAHYMIGSKTDAKLKKILTKKIKNLEGIV